MNDAPNRTALLLTPPWGELGGTRPATGRPYLDLLLLTQGWGRLETREAWPDTPLALPAADRRPSLVLAQDDANGLVGRALLTALRAEGNPGQAGVTLIRDAQGLPQGYAVARPGLLALCLQQGGVWETRASWLPLLEERADEFGWSEARVQAPYCWLVEGEVRAEQSGRWLEELLFPEPPQWRLLPGGDLALLLPRDRSAPWYAELAAQLNYWMISTTPRPLEEVVGERLLARGWRAATAESCTAGLTAARLSAVAGSSAWLEGGFVTYSNRCKETHLGVPAALLASKGAVSAEVAEAMARGAMAATGAEVAVAITGIAGPGGATPDKPVGTVYLAGITRQGELVPRHVVLRGDRETVRYRSSQAALHILRRLAEGA